MSRGWVFLPWAILFPATGSMVCPNVLPDPGEVDFRRGPMSQQQRLGTPG